MSLSEKDTGSEVPSGSIPITNPMTMFGKMSLKEILRQHNLDVKRERPKNQEFIQQLIY